MKQFLQEPQNLTDDELIEKNIEQFVEDFDFFKSRRLADLRDKEKKHQKLRKYQKNPRISKIR